VQSILSLTILEPLKIMTKILGIVLIALSYYLIPTFDLIIELISLYFFGCVTATIISIFLLLEVKDEQTITDKRITGVR